MFAAKLAVADPVNAGAGLLAAWLDTMHDAVVLCDYDWRISALSRAARTLLGIGDEDVAGMNASSVLGVQRPDERLGKREWRLRVEGEPNRVWEVRGVRLSHGATGAEGWALILAEAHSTGSAPDFIGRSAPVRELLEFVSRIAASRVTTILVEGESGTGKELVARRLHGLGPNADGPFVALNCAAVPATLLESEVFGHERGAFTDAHASREGLLEAAHRGTLFLDEIGEMPLALQSKLLRVLEERTFRRVGGAKTIRVDLRVIAASNRDLHKAIEEGAFRGDLYYRLNVVQIRIPPLRERPEDIPELARHFLRQFNREHQRALEGIHPNAMRALESYAWPGNVRELRNVIERGVLVEQSSHLTASSLCLGGSRALPALSVVESNPAPFSLRGTERELIAAALQQAGGNQTRAAALLGIGRFSLRYKMRKLGLL